MSRTLGSQHLTSHVSFIITMFIFLGAVVIYGMPNKAIAEAVYFSANMDGAADATMSCQQDSRCAIVFRPSEPINDIDLIRVRFDTSTTHMYVYELENATTSININQIIPTPAYYGPLIAAQTAVRILPDQTPEDSIVDYIFSDGLSFVPEKYYAFVFGSATSTGSVYLLGKNNSLGVPFGLRYDPTTGQLISDPNFPPFGGSFTPALELVNTTQNGPAIDLFGDNPITITQGGDFVDPGAYAQDVEDGDLTHAIVVEGAVDTGTPGEYALSYSVTDSDGHSATVNRTVSVTAVPQSPIITLLGDNPMQITQGDDFSDPGAIATDYEDGDLTGSIVVEGTVDTGSVGEYVLSYAITDSDGLSATTSRSVEVVDTNTAEAVYFSANMTGEVSENINCQHESTLCAAVFRPGESISGVDIVRMRLGTTTGVTLQVYELENATTSINVNNIVPTPPYYGSLVAESANVVEIHYTPEFGAMGIAEFDFPGGLSLSSEANTHYAFVLQTTDQIFVWGANNSFSGPFGFQYSPITGTLMSGLGGEGGAGGCVDTGSGCGLFTPALELADSTVSLTNPTIALLGDNPMTTEQGSEFADPGATATDEEDGDLTGSIVVEGEVNTEDPGEYVLSYSVTDSTGLSASVSRTVVVEATDLNIVDTDGDGIMDSVDTAMETYSDDFMDGITYGTITSRGGQLVLVEDSADENEGVILSSHINFTGTATGTPATVHVCDAATIMLTDGDKVVVTCGSVILDVLEGEVEAELFADNGLTSSVSVSAGNEVIFHPEENTISAAPENTNDITATSGGEGLVVTPGATVSLTPSTALTVLNPAHVWIGLKNSDDVGTKFDVLAEVYKNGVLISAGQINSVHGGSSGFNNAKLNIIPFNSFSPTNFPAGSNMSFKLSVRNTCTGPTHNSGTARLWFNDTVANSYFGVLLGDANTNYSLRNGFVLAATAGLGPRKTIDVAAGAPCSAFKSFGTWTIAL